MKSRFILYFLICFSLLPSCRRDDQIQTYRVAKDTESTPALENKTSTDIAPKSNPVPVDPMPQGTRGPIPPMASTGSDMNAAANPLGLTPAASPKEVSWTVPSGWVEQAPSAMRIGSFLIKGLNGQSAEASVVPLSGDAGGDLANINRWRSQLSLEPVTKDQLGAISQSKTFAGRRMLWVEFPSREKLISNQFKRRLIAVIYKENERSWFFKMMGEDLTVQNARPAFEKFLASLRFQNPS